MQLSPMGHADGTRAIDNSLARAIFSFLGALRRLHMQYMTMEGRR